MSGVRRISSVRPMLSGAFTEWLPTFGVSWQVVQVPVNRSGSVTPFGKVKLLRPATPLSTIGLVLKMTSPRAIDRRARSASSDADRLGRAQAPNNEKALGSNGVPAGFIPTGSLMPMKNGCLDSVKG